MTDVAVPRMTPRIRLAFLRSKLAVLEAPGEPGVRPPTDLEERIAAIRSEIDELAPTVDGMFTLPERRDVDG